MKLQIISLLTLLTCQKVFAAEATESVERSGDIRAFSDEDCDGYGDGDKKGDGDEVYVEVHRSYQTWDYLLNEEVDAYDISLETPVETAKIEWSLMSYLSNLLQFSSPLKKSESVPLIESSQVNIVEMATIFNCQVVQLAEINLKTLESLAPYVKSSRSKILARIAELNDRDLFELFYDHNATLILSESTTEASFNAIILNCFIKMDIINPFINFMFQQQTFQLNGPQAIVFASMYGSVQILELIFKTQEIPDYEWSWKNIDGSSGSMADFGSTPLAAGLFIGAIKAIENGHLNCLQVLIREGVELGSNNFLLLKQAGEQANLEIFITVYTSITSSIPNKFVNAILADAIKKNNEEMVNYVLSLPYNYRPQFKKHLLSAISTNNPALVDRIISVLPTGLSDQITSDVLNIAAASGNVDVLLMLIKVSLSEEIFKVFYSYILNEQYHKYVPLITSVIRMNSDAVSQALLYSVRGGYVDFIELFLAEPECAVATARPGFLAALDSNNRAIIHLFPAKFGKTSLLNLNIKGHLENVIKDLIEKRLWESLAFIVHEYINAKQFPKHLFMAMIMETDQFEIAQYAANLGLSFPQTKLSEVKDSRMRELVLSQATPVNRK